MPNNHEKNDLPILVVDDQLGVRLTMEGVLSKKGYRVAVADSGAQALDLARETPFRVVFMDIKMPGMNGVDALIKMKEINPDVIVVMMTGFAVEEDMKRAMREGAHSVIYKPFEMEKIFSILEDCAEGHRLILVMDKQPGDQPPLQDILVEKGFKVITVQSVDDCFQQVQNRVFQIIILNVKQPGISDLETLKRVKKIQSDVSVVLVASQPAEKMIEQLLEKESLSFLRRPFDAESLLQTMEQCLKNRTEKFRGEGG